MAKSPSKKIFASLGNPGDEYANTYHNAGRLALAAVMHEPFDKETGWEKHKDLFYYRSAPGAAFVKPLTFMNESGKAIKEALKKFDARPHDLVLFQDDSDITVGSYKISFARNSAGHKGVQSVIDALKTNEFTRVRIGIRPEKEKERQKAGTFALKAISSKDRKTLDGVFKEIGKELAHLYENSIWKV